MPQKFVVGQRVRIIPVDNGDILHRYPDISKHIKETGIIANDGMTIQIGEVLSGLKEPLPPQPLIEIVVYKVRLDEGNKVIEVPHEALELAS